MLTVNNFKRIYDQQIAQRWDNFELSPMLMIDWFEQLKGFDELVLTDAVRKHYLDDEPRTPSLKKIYGYAKAAMRPTGQSPNSTGHVIEMRCTEAGWVRAGVVRRVHVAGSKAACTDDALAQEACRLIERYTRTYGGQWQPKIVKDQNV